MFATEQSLDQVCAGKYRMVLRARLYTTRGHAKNQITNNPSASPNRLNAASTGSQLPQIRSADGFLSLRT
jgi:hypothetical protein